MISLWTLGARLVDMVRRPSGFLVEWVRGDAGGGSAEPPPADGRDPGADLLAAMALSADMLIYVPGWYCPSDPGEVCPDRTGNGGRP